MTAVSEQDHEWVAGVATRLLEVRSRSAGAPAEQRLEFVREELGRVMEGLPESQRETRLAALLERFPVGGEVMRKVSPVAAAVPPSEECGALTVEEMVERLLVAVGGLPEEERKALGRRLAEAGLGAVDRDELVMEVGDRLTQVLQIPAGLQPRLSSVVELLALLVGMFQRMDQITMKALIEIRPRGAGGAMAGEFRKGVAKYLLGEGELPLAQVEGTERCLAALVAAVLACGKEFGRELAGKLSPWNIREVVQKEGGRGTAFFGKSLNEKCWEKYVELANEHAKAEWLDRKLKDTYAAFIERTMAAAARGGG